MRTNSAQTTVQKIVLYMEGNQTIECNASELDSIVFVDTEAEENDVHEYVDLGLPSGTLWATCNVGANSPEEYGDYFAWGETEPKNDYSWSTYKYCKGSKNTMTKYCTSSEYGTVDNKTELEAADDAATANWGSDWQMPSEKQIVELFNSHNTTTTWTTMNGVDGRKITSKSNGNSIFLPAAGYRYDTSLINAGSSGYYWSRSLYTSNSSDAYYLYFYSTVIRTNYYYRYYGQSVRPVRVDAVQTVVVSNIELSQTELSVKVGETSQLSTTALPENASNKNLKWESSDTDVATVDQSGKVTAVAVGTCTITCSATDLSGVKAVCEVTVWNDNHDDSGTLDGHDYVDLGLPSGTLWATCNVGANSPEEYGDYFAWGETGSKSNYLSGTYKYCKDFYHTMTKYCTSSDYGIVDNKTELELSDDAATVNWGSDWQMPSEEQFKELINSSNTTTTWTTMNGVEGRMITSKSKSNSIFLPAAGYRGGTSLDNAGSRGYYWSRSLYTSVSDDAYYLYFNSSNIYTSDGTRCYGRSVRPVRVQRNKESSVTGIDLNKTELLLVPKAFTQLTVTIQPWYATNKNLKWESSNKAIATVDETGKVVAVAAGSCTITCSATDGSGVKAECQVTVLNGNSGTLDGHDYVDLGLPSGTLWATCNVGASSPEEYGDYFAWGETEPKSSYSWRDYKYCGFLFDALTKYCTNSSYGIVDNKIELEPSDDAATANWGSNWQMPSREQCAELINSNYTTITWTTLNGKYGRKITSKSNGNSIFLPAAGWRDDTSLSSAGSSGCYWSRSLDTSRTSYNACNLYFYSSSISTYNNFRYYGQSVRPVRVKN